MMSLNIQKAFCIAALAVMLLLIMVLTLACSGEYTREHRGELAHPPPPPPSILSKAREQQCRDFGRYCEQERDGDHVR
jgi:hypothetical protein